MNLRNKLKLYVITDRRLKPEVESVREALEGGATAIQMRIKNAPTREMYEIGKTLRQLTREYDALFFVDDRVDVALAVDADGVQLGPEDMPIEVAKEIAPNLIIGASVYSLEEALEAEKKGADYLGAGSVFPTKTKEDARVIGLEGLRKIVESVKIPVVAIGGINKDNAREVLKTGVDGIAVISAVMGAEDVRKATEELRKIVEEVLG
ncbi:thiamine phosphate synthase [Pyrococcus furiosus DSM 3638]|uniref:Thiamine-phosphate synthase n=3 Tax=Pyrococcus furiosus TaxID=2261 RepID=THIE_PYRFU|nr:thiamine phosphate synthase [Pyrococcus furiosus]Q8U192.1 RecName: Full=Thiamine-phosphate synthase; Short=TP synthase; Short=TPS; AltName: Full=Thiamine-phosphate pyrophosphorylase; Short=TMP pyrophosphorylase; Short=TMP-PPase [Pyrococcus furiosus DSM 3638]AAL81458.1 thiamine phosphate pyrophosphorylase [Pyrococcus furiosus DSM 3638]AFN04114.1 thiamine-phosphate pyrophosphorylase [Pyrococcus furiosus COM1]QEK78969.1 thiamine phosphate synthase [Pyrococcus furiosus DSM 3638]